MIGRGLEQAVMGMVIMFAVVGFVLGGFVFWLLPKIWAWLKPLIHAATS